MVVEGESLIDLRVFVLTIVLLYILTAIVPYVNTSNVVNELQEANNLVVYVDYPIKLNCNDPFAGNNGFIAHLFLAKVEGYNWLNFHSLNEGTIVSRSYYINENGTYDYVVQRMVFFFTTSGTRTITIRSGVEGWTSVFDSLIIPSFNYQAYVNYRYIITFPVRVQQVGAYGSIVTMLGIPNQGIQPVTLNHRFYASGQLVSLSPSISVIYSNPSSGSFTWQIALRYVFNNANDIGKSFDELVVTSSCGTCGTPWSNLIHVHFLLPQTFTIGDVGDALTIVFNIQLQT